MWDFYDRDRSNSLDKNESFNFITDILIQAKLTEGFCQFEYHQKFNEYDVDGSGTMQKIEMF